MKTTIISAIYDNYDIPKPVLPQTGIEVEWIMVTDTLKTAELARSAGWMAIVEPRKHVHPNRAAKTPKCLPWLYVTTDSSIWIDGSFRVVSPRFADDVLKYAQPIAQFKHPWRDCAYDEAVECINIPKYAIEPLEEQIKKYYDEGLPANWGLWATGVIARHHTPQVINMGFEWMSDIHRWSYQDQVSQPAALFHNGLRPIEFPGNHLANQWLAYQGSERHSHG